MEWCLTIVPTVLIQLVRLGIQDVPEGWVCLAVYVDFPRVDTNDGTYSLIRPVPQILIDGVYLP
jgi:hypothetical protein